MMGVLLLLSLVVAGLTYIIGARRFAQRLLLVTVICALLSPLIAPEVCRLVTEFSSWIIGLSIFLGLILLGFASKRSIDSRRPGDRPREPPATSLKRRMESL